MLHRLAPSTLGVLLAVSMGATACSTVRLTPRAAKLAAQGDQGIETIKEDIEAKSNEIKDVLAAQDRTRAAVSKAAEEVIFLGEDMQLDSRELEESIVELRGLDPSDESYLGLVQGIAARARSLGAENERVAELEDAILGLRVLPNLADLEDELDYLQRDLRQLRSIQRGEYEYFVDGSIYFSVEPVIAIEEGLKTTAIPSLGINWRPFPRGTYASALGTQLILGGALNPSNDEDNATGAIGMGLSYPIGGAGAFAFGVVTWDDGDESQVAGYFSVSLGDFAKSVD